LRGWFIRRLVPSLALSLFVSFPPSRRKPRSTPRPESFTTVVNGTTIELRHQLPNCPILPIGGSAEIDLGLLPAGSSTLRLVDVSDAQHPEVDDTTTFTVATATASCTPSAFTACALNDRFRVSVRYRASSTTSLR
jgi:hypothetical protein